MIIQSVTAHHFGPLAAETIELAEGLTVIYGPNESAKSTWHAAIYAALCGRKRGKGRPTEEEQHFIDLHRPWDGPGFAGGDQRGNVAGGDQRGNFAGGDQRGNWLVSARVLLDDGRHIELRQELDDRVACDAVDLDVGRDCSAEIINDGTPDAARWLGLDRHSFLGTACIAQAQVLDVLQRAGGLQGHLQRAASTAGAADQTATSAIECIDKFRAERVGGERAFTKPLPRAVSAAQHARANLDRARADHAEHDQRLAEVNRLRAAADSADREVRLQEAAVAMLAARQARARADQAMELDARVSAAGATSIASEDVAAEVAAALATWRSRPVAPAVQGRPVDAADLSDDQLRELARDLQEDVAPRDPEIEDRLASARVRVSTAVRRRARGRAVTAIGVVPALAGAALLAFGEELAVVALGSHLLAAAALFAAGLVLMLAGWWTARRAGDVAGARTSVAEAELDAAAHGRSATRVQARREAAVARCESAGLPADPVALRELADRRADADAFARRDEQWGQEALRAAADHVLRCARGVRIDAQTAEGAVDGLVRWQQERAAHLALLEQARDESARLKALLGGGTLADLVHRADTANERADRLLADVTTVDAELGPLIDSAELLDDDRLRDLRTRAREASEAARVAEVALAECAARAVPVGEAEEDLARVEAELALLRELDTTLDLTRQFLLMARERAHRTIAPVLASAVRRWLPAATGGRYTEVTVDPEKLRVQVRGPAGRWRDAGLLSFGTAEQVYLMLRIALAEHLVRAGTVCPLLLDDVTVHADRERVIQILELLLRASADRQIVLFTQQDQVRAWARERLADRDALRELATVTTV